MPTYVYKFVDTGETIEIQQSFRDDALTEAVHPMTGTVLPVKKVFLPVGVTFKGDGFYKTDSRSTKSKSGSSGSSESSGNGESSSSSSSESSGASSGTASTPAPASSSNASAD